MPERRRGSGGSRQPDLFARSKQPKISLPDNHPMVVLTDTVDWTEMEVRAEKIRAKKLKSAAGRPPHLRATLGADADGASEAAVQPSVINCHPMAGAVTVKGRL